MKIVETTLHKWGRCRMCKVLFAAAFLYLINAGTTKADTNELQFVSSLTTNNELRLYISWPTSLSGTVWEVYTVDLDDDASMSFSWLDLWWNLAETNLALTGAMPHIWIDSGQLGRLSPLQVDSRYYAFGSTAVDVDFDGIINSREYLLTKTDANDDDSDDDELSDYEEIYSYFTDPLNPDSDDDGIPDGWEVQYGLNPLSGLDDSLVGWWKFDETGGTNALNSALLGYDGQLVNISTSAWVSGKLANAIQFDGTNDYVRVPQSPVLITGQQFTASGWVYLDTIYGDDYPTIISDFDLCSYNYGGFWLGWDKNGSGAGLFGATCIGPYYIYILDSSSITGQWHHIATTFNGSTGKVYLNGTEVVSAPGSFAPANQSEIRIGWANDPSASYYWEGKLDDIRLYTTALSSNAVHSMYDALQDPDGDSVNNYYEYLQGRNPLVGATNDVANLTKLEVYTPSSP